MQSSCFKLVCSAVAAFAAALGSAAMGEVTIIGALTNFDCPNNTPDVCDEFEIEFEGPHPEDVLHTYCNWNYGCPTVSSNASSTGVIITYKKEGRWTSIGAIEHYGVYLRDWNVVTIKTFRWKHNGAVVTSGHGTPPVSTPRPVVVTTPVGTVEVVEPIENEQPEESIWVRRSVTIVPREVSLEELMIDDPLITAATPIDAELERLGPGEMLEALEPVDMEDYVQTQIIIVETFEDIATWNPATGQFDHQAGLLVSRAMNATVIQVQPCTDLPVINADPVDTSGTLDGRAEFSVDASVPAGGGQIVYQWRHEGVDLVGEDNPTLSIDPLTPADAGAYFCVVSDDCGSVVSLSAYLTVVAPPQCYGDADDDRRVDFNDVMEVLSHFGTDYGAQSGAGDADFNGRVNFADILSILANFTSVCPGI